MPAKKKVLRTTGRKKAAKKPAVAKAAGKKRPAAKQVKSASKAKVAVVRRAASVSVLKAAPSVKEPFTKTELVRTLAEMTGLGSRDVKNVLEGLQNVIHEHMKSRGPQKFTLLGLAKFKVVRKPATKARKGINPFTGEPTVFKAKPARNAVKVLALKGLKEVAK